jgi:hypothetical protein
MVPSESLALQDKTLPRSLPSEWCLVNLSKSKTAALIGILDMGEVIVKVVIGGVSSLENEIQHFSTSDRLRTPFNMYS